MLDLLPVLEAIPCGLARLWWVPVWSVLGAAMVPLLASAQTDDGVAIAVRVRGQGSAACLDAQALRRRVAHYRRSRRRISGVRVEVVVDGPDAVEVRVIRGLKLASRRRFEALPARCAERRDTVAVSLALALEGMASQRSARRAASEAIPNDGLAADPASAREGRRPKDPDVRAPLDTAVQQGHSAEHSAESEAGARRAGGPVVGDGAVRGHRAEPEGGQRRATAPAGERALAGVEIGASSSVAPVSPVSRRPASDGVLEASEVSETMAEGLDVESETAEETRVADADVMRSETASVALDLHLGGHLLAEALPMPVWVGAVGAQLRFGGPLSLDLSAFASTLGNVAFEGGRARARLTGAELLACAGWPGPSRSWLGVCVGGVAAAAWVGGRDYPEEFSDTVTAWLAPASRLSLRFAVQDWLSFRLLVRAHVSAVRPELAVQGAGDPLRPSLLGGLMGIDALVSFD